MKRALILGAFVLLSAVAGRADTLLFNLSPTNGTTNRAPGSGPGQGVQVSNTTTIDNFAFYLNAPNGADVKFMIWNGDNTSLLYSQTEMVAASSTPSWVETSPFSFTLNAGSTYYFGVIADAQTLIGYIYPTVGYSANGLTALSDGNSNYSGFADPALGGPALAEIGLQIYGNGSVSATPEPGSLALLGTGVLGVAGAIRRRLISK